MARSSLLSSLSLVTGWLLLATPATAQSSVIDPTHYWSWTPANPIPVVDSIKVRDQFFPQDTLLYVMRFERLLNPVHKFHYPEGPETPIRDSTLHLTWYDVQPPLHPEFVARIFDQFHPDGWVAPVGNLEFMLVPAGKDTVHSPPEPFPQQGSHYLCYRFEVPAPDAFVRLRDQFRIADHIPVFNARYLCNPCWKSHRDRVHPPRDLETHLVVYHVDTPWPFRSTWIHDQFTDDIFQVHQTPIEWLLVPARKEALRTSVEDPGVESSWGKVKQLYR